MQGAVRNKAYS